VIEPSALSMTVASTPGISPSGSACFGRPSRRDDPAPNNTPTTSCSPILHDSLALVVGGPLAPGRQLVPEQLADGVPRQPVHEHHG
jgi:hypothetical protein